MACWLADWWEEGGKSVTVGRESVASDSRGSTSVKYPKCEVSCVARNDRQIIGEMLPDGSTIHSGLPLVFILAQSRVLIHQAHVV